VTRSAPVTNTLFADQTQVVFEELCQTVQGLPPDDLSVPAVCATAMGLIEKHCQTHGLKMDKKTWVQKAVPAAMEFCHRPQPVETAPKAVGPLIELLLTVATGGHGFGHRRPLAPLEDLNQNTAENLTALTTTTQQAAQDVITDVAATLVDGVGAVGDAVTTAIANQQAHNQQAMDDLDEATRPRGCLWCRASVQVRQARKAQKAEIQARQKRRQRRQRHKQQGKTPAPSPSGQEPTSTK